MAWIILYRNISNLLETVNPFHQPTEHVSDNDSLAALLPLKRPGFVVASLYGDIGLLEQVGNDPLLFRTAEVDDVSQLFIELCNGVAPEIVTVGAGSIRISRRRVTSAAEAGSGSPFGPQR